MLNICISYWAVSYCKVTTQRNSEIIQITDLSGLHSLKTFSIGNRSSGTSAHTHLETEKSYITHTHTLKGHFTPTWIFAVCMCNDCLSPDTQFGQTWHLSTQLHSGERIGRQLLCSTTTTLLTLVPYYTAAWFRSPSSVMVSAEPFSDRSTPMRCNSTQMGPCQIIDTQLWTAADYEPYHRSVCINKSMMTYYN